jgi:hypothetical protein
VAELRKLSARDGAAEVRADEAHVRARRINTYTQQRASTVLFTGTMAPTLFWSLFTVGAPSAFDDIRFGDRDDTIVRDSDDIRVRGIISATRHRPSTQRLRALALAS